MKIKQIDFSEALDRVRKGEKVFVMKVSGKPVVKLFKYVSIEDALDCEKSILFIFEGGDIDE